MEDPDLTEYTRMISVDRPGYGYSDFGRSVTSIKEQAIIINDIIKKESDHPAILIGHSYGGPIAVKSAMLDPELIKSMILLAPAIDPEYEKIFKIAYFGKIPPFRWITPRSWKVAADEKLSHVKELQKMMNDWERLNTPIIHVHGNKDRLVPYANIEFSRKMIKDPLLHTISIEGEDHFLPWTQKQLIKEILLDQINSENIPFSHIP
jgi:pimeloyl-ACP methyl ester carboxylesterase